MSFKDSYLFRETKSHKNFFFNSRIGESHSDSDEEDEEEYTEEVQGIDPNSAFVAMVGKKIHSNGVSSPSTTTTTTTNGTSNNDNSSSFTSSDENKRSKTNEKTNGAYFFLLMIFFSNIVLSGLVIVFQASWSSNPEVLKKATSGAVDLVVL